MYAFATLSEVTVKKHLRADGYMWVNKRTQFSPNGAIAKTYFYARLECAIITRDAVVYTVAPKTGLRSEKEGISLVRVGRMIFFLK